MTGFWTNKDDKYFYQRKKEKIDNLFCCSISIQHLPFRMLGVHAQKEPELRGQF